MLDILEQFVFLAANVAPQQAAKFHQQRLRGRDAHAFHHGFERAMIGNQLADCGKVAQL